MTRPYVLQADLTWTGDRFRPDVQVAVDAAGRIDAVGRLGRRATRLPGRALLPGFVNAHSHAFQRGLRGHGERFPAGAGSFWTWRDSMYRLVNSLDARAFRGLCLQAFLEMRDAGITTVGEFHYLHHLTPGDFALDPIVLDAAAEAGIRIVLLETYYATSGIGRPLERAQRRFGCTSPDEFWHQMDTLADQLAPGTQSLGVVAHSIRAVPLDAVAPLYAEAVRRGLPFHMHVEEQEREVDECRAAYGKRPMAMLLDRLGTAANLTAVHCTQTTDADLDAFLDAGGTVCVCPLTEANLGDGLPHLGPAHETGGRLSLGTDSNARIGFLEEMRWLEYGQRLRSRLRGALADEAGTVAATLIGAATTGGARALGLPVGRIVPGYAADFVAVDLTAPQLAGATTDSLPEALVFGGGSAAIAATCVAGRWRETPGSGG